MSDSKNLKIPEWINKLHNESNEMEKLNIINQNIPRWIVEVIDHYSPDYSYLENNWYKLTEIAKTTPKKIVIVDRIPMDKNEPNYLEIIILCDYMTKNGYVVRRKGELIKCPVCNKALLSEKVYDSVYNMNTENITEALFIKSQIPDYWDKKCQNCS